jgi:aminoglycoside phosphotransferase (APT) family kinase protein
VREGLRGCFGEAARSQPWERVLCHGDRIGDNPLSDRAGRLWAVDWDAVTLPPRERDLALFAGQGFERFLDDYGPMAGGLVLGSATDPSRVTVSPAATELGLTWMATVAAGANQTRPGRDRQSERPGGCRT